MSKGAVPRAFSTSSLPRASPYQSHKQALTSQPLPPFLPPNPSCLKVHEIRLYLCFFSVRSLPRLQMLPFQPHLRIGPDLHLPLTTVLILNTGLGALILPLPLTLSLPSLNLSLLWSLPKPFQSFSSSILKFRLQIPTN